MTLRRFLPHEAPSSAGEDAINFALALDRPPLDMGPDVIPYFDLWHVANYFSSGQIWEESLPDNVLLGGSPWFSSEPEHEPPKLLSPKQVAEAHAHLSNLSDDLLKRRFDEMLDLGRDIHHGPQSDVEFDPLMTAFNDIRAFFAEAALKQQAILKTMA